MQKLDINLNKKNIKIFFKKIDLINYEIKSWIRRLNVYRWFSWEEVNELNVKNKETYKYILSVIKDYIKMDSELIWKVYYNG